VLRAMAVLFLVGPLRSVPYIRLERELRFSRIAGIELAATFTRQLVTVVLAWRLGGMRALAGGQLAGALVQLALAWRSARGWPGLGIDPKVLRATLGEGVPVQALAIAAFFKDNLSAALLGSLMGPAAVGRFDFGLKYAALPVQAVNALSRVQLPVYARFDAKDPQLYQAFVGATRTALLLGVPLLVALSVGAPVHRAVALRPALDRLHPRGARHPGEHGLRPGGGPALHAAAGAGSRGPRAEGLRGLDAGHLGAGARASGTTS
jgi:O-antigen/teichoic acid export membrane protein